MFTPFCTRYKILELSADELRCTSLHRVLPHVSVVARVQTGDSARLYSRRFLSSPISAGVGSTPPCRINSAGSPPQWTPQPSPRLPRPTRSSVPVRSPAPCLLSHPHLCPIPTRLLLGRRAHADAFPLPLSHVQHCNAA